MGTSMAPESPAATGGVTVRSSVVQSDSQRSGAGGPAASPASRLLPGTSCWQATGQAPGAKPSAAAAIDAPRNGEPSVTTRLALRLPESSRAQSSTVTPPAE